MLFINIAVILTVCLGFCFNVAAGTLKADCIISEFSEVSKVVKNCTSIVVSNLYVPAGETLDLDLKTGTGLMFDGITTFGVAHWDGPLIRIKGKHLTVLGGPGSRIDGQGEKYWDGKGGQGTKKPVFMRIYAYNGSVFEDIHLLNCPERCVTVAGSDIHLSGWNIDVSAGDKNKLGHNTDGFGASGQNILIENSVVKNQDDCAVVGRGSNIKFRNIHCSGGHGLSLSVGLSKSSYENNVVSNVSFVNCIVVNSDNGIHIKTHKDGGPGLIQDVTYSNITLEGIRKYGMEIQQDYPMHDKKPVNNVAIKRLTIENVHGTMSGGKSVPVYVMCASGGCSNWNWANISIKGNKKPCSINYKPSGFSC